jgi:hypothetical protein
MPASNTPFSRAALVIYVQEMVAEALESGTIDPASGLECFLYATDPKTVLALREFTALKPALREEVLSMVRLLAAGSNDEKNARDLSAMH